MNGLDEFGVATVDTHYMGEAQRAAAFLLVEGTRAAFIDNNTRFAVPRLLDALEQAGRDPAEVDYLFVTHVHLDHAGGTAALLDHCPNATVMAHPRAARHLADPARLVAGAKAVYGEAVFEQLYGEIAPIPGERVRALADEESIAWGGRTLRFLHTLGHASHHGVIHDSRSNGIFSGDALGIGRGPHLRPGPSFVIAAAAPPDFDPAAARDTVRRLLGLAPDRAYLAHFGRFDDVADIAGILLRNIDQLEAIMADAEEHAIPDPDLEAFIAPRVSRAFDEHLHACGVADFAGDRARIEGDVTLTAMGLAHRIRRQRG
jgi:glyoxylase-like metal-dependent hydrolase (beta-lactamase superfamily II)